MPDVYNPGILETYIASRKDMLDRERQAQNDAVDNANKIAETEHRTNLAKQTAIDLETEHQRNMARLDADQAQIDAHRAEIAHAHLQSKMAILQAIKEGTIPVPPQQFTPNGQTQQFQTSPAAQVTNVPQGNYIKPPMTFDGTTLQPNEYQAPAQIAQQQQPLINSQIQNEGRVAYAKSLNTEQGAEDVRKQPGGLYEQQTNLETQKTDQKQRDDQKAYDRQVEVERMKAAALESNSIRSANARLTAAQIAANGKIDPGEVADRAVQLKYGEGPAQGQNKNDLHALSVLSQQGEKPVSPTIVKNIQGLTPLEKFSADMKSFADTYLSGSSAVNWAKVSIPGSDANNAYNQLQLQATNIAKSVEGATGRILKSQIDLAKAFVANKIISKDNMIKNAKKLDELNTNTLDGLLGNKTPKQRVEFLDHYDMEHFSDLMSARWKVKKENKPQIPQQQSLPQTNLLKDPNYEVVH